MATRPEQSGPTPRLGILTRLQPLLRPQLLPRAGSFSHLKALTHLVSSSGQLHSSSRPLHRSPLLRAAAPEPQSGSHPGPLIVLVTVDLAFFFSPFF